MMNLLNISLSFVKIVVYSLHQIWYNNSIIVEERRYILLIMCEVNGRHPSLSQKEILEVFFWGVSQLMPRKENLDVRIDIYNIDDNVTGYHCKTDIHEIEIEKDQNISDFITALFHELVHVRQTERRIFSDQSIAYYDRPTEIEAYQLQEELYIKWKKNFQSTRQ